MIIVSWLMDSGRGITINACMLDDYDCYVTNERHLHEEQLHEEMVFSKNLCRLLNKASHLTAFYALYGSLHLPVTPILFIMIIFEVLSH